MSINEKKKINHDNNSYKAMTEEDSSRYMDESWAIYDVEQEELVPFKTGFANNYQYKSSGLEIEFIDDYIKNEHEVPGTFSNVVFLATKMNEKRAQEQVKNLLMERIPRGSVVCVVPSSTAGKVSGLELILKDLAAMKSLSVEKLIVRANSKDKATYGGSRDRIAHYMTLECAPRKEIEGKRIILIDDISTTGNSLFACKKLLEKNGARHVRVIVLGRTRNE